MQFLALSGSLRAVSSNTEVLLACASLAPYDVVISLFRGVAEIPHFNPDLEEVSVPPAAVVLREAVERCDALVISCPEYAHGVPGAFKNALDWIVGVGLGRRPVALLNTSPSARHAHAALLEVLATMDGVPVEAACIRLPLPGRLDAAAITRDPNLVAPLRASLSALAAAVRASVGA
jgi:chromate reductase